MEHSKKQPTYSTEEIKNSFNEMQNKLLSLHHGTASTALPKTDEVAKSKPKPKINTTTTIPKESIVGPLVKKSSPPPSAAGAPPPPPSQEDDDDDIEEEEEEEAKPVALKRHSAKNAIPASRRGKKKAIKCAELGINARLERLHELNGFSGILIGRSGEIDENGKLIVVKHGLGTSISRETCIATPDISLKKLVPKKFVEVVIDWLGRLEDAPPADKVEVKDNNKKRKHANGHKNVKRIKAVEKDEIEEDKDDMDDDDDDDDD